MNLSIKSTSISKLHIYEHVCLMIKQVIKSDIERIEEYNLNLIVYLCISEVIRYLTGFKSDFSF